MTNLIVKYSLKNQIDLTLPRSTQLYKLGQVVNVEDSDTKVIAQYIYIKAHTTLTQYQPYVLAFGGTTGSEVITGDPVTISAPGVNVVIPQVAFTSGYYGFVLLSGVGKALMTAESYVVGDALQLLNGGSALNVDGTSESTSFSIYTCAYCKETASDAVARSVNLINRQCVIESSGGGSM
jgi:hypothetical protein